MKVGALCAPVSDVVYSGRSEGLLTEQLPRRFHVQLVNAGYAPIATQMTSSLTRRREIRRNFRSPRHWSSPSPIYAMSTAG